jgi:hypothetical protein
MTASGWFAAVVGVPFLLVASWWSTRQIWSKGRDFTQGPSLLPTNSATATASVQLPIAVAFTCGALGSLWTFFVSGTHPRSPTLPAELFAAGAVFSLLGAVWMFLFAWPRFLVPPAYRGQPGWIGTTWRRARHASERSDGGRHRER